MIANDKIHNVFVYAAVGSAASPVPLLFFVKCAARVSPDAPLIT